MTIVRHMLYESCHQREALVHLRRVYCAEGLEHEPGTWREQHFCEECADEHFTRKPGMNSRRDLICLSDWYGSKLYDLLETAHPEAFDSNDTEACRRGSELMQTFLREQLAKAKLQLNEDAFEMLCRDFFGSHHYYTREDEYKRRKG